MICGRDLKPLAILLMSLAKHSLKRCSEKDYFVAFADMDASPTKSWLVSQFGRSQWQWFYDLAFEKRPAEELYDLSGDPDEMQNLAGQAAYSKVQRELSEQLMKVLIEMDDPRVIGDGLTFERPPFTN